MVDFLSPRFGFLQIMPTSLTAKQLEEEQEILEQGQRTAHLHGLWTGAAVFLGIVVVARTSRLAFKQAGAYGVLGKDFWRFSSAMSIQVKMSVINDVMM